MLPNERKEKIFSLLAKQNHYSTNELCRILDISRVSVNKLLAEMQEEGLIRRVRGGAESLSKEKEQTKNSFEIRMDKNYKSKRDIAQKAIRLVKDSDTIFIDSSTTCNIFSRQIARMEYRNLTMITTSPHVITNFSHTQNVHAICTGGVFQSDYDAFIGSIATNLLKQFNIDKSFISVQGLSMDKGLMTSQMFIHETLKLIFTISRQVYLLADSTKFLASGFMCIAPVEDISTLVTDKGADPEFIRCLREEKNVNVVI